MPKKPKNEAASVVAKSLQRIDLRRAPRGDVARDHGHTYQQQGDRREGRWIGRAQSCRSATIGSTFVARRAGL
jgi:hypothetical protein